MGRKLTAVYRLKPLESVVVGAACTRRANSDIVYTLNGN